ncbi:hypothetical protein AOQ84DRAFT_289371 [Glonium stellatum]|uniref:Uncharacterized protein n=1 Tax=Glonium stellatum TaxID=574774 RepID=A0A8E2JUU1_9PEZI|nr:hypothetical protein AOQ84DRAFT_289371 [Glonium stellatum]
MTHFTFFIFLALTTLTTSSPAPTDCPRTKCYTATNECGIPYGGQVELSCWDECEDASDRLRTFTNPLCSSSTPLSANSVFATPTSLPLASITSSGLPSSTDIVVGRLSGAGLITPHTECTPFSICVDAMNNCGVRYGGCYDTCQPTSLTAPPCPLASPKFSSTYAITSVSGGRNLSAAASPCIGIFCRPW